MPVLPSAVVIIFLGGILLVRRHDIRLVLLASAAAMYFLRATQPEVGGHRWDLFGQYFLEFAKGMTNPASVVPICSAMGFAYVCKHTKCDAHLVHMLISPLRHIRPLLVPGGIAVAFVVNSAIVSQTSTVAVVGPVLIPLLLAGGISRRTAGALLLLGGSMGGELLNPAAVEVTAIKMLTQQDTNTVVRHILPWNLIASGTALIVFWMMSLYWQKRDSRGEAALPESDALDTMDVPHAGVTFAMTRDESDALPRVNVLYALVPLVPILLLMFVKPFIPLPEAFRYSENNKVAEQAAIASAMLIGVTVAGLFTRNNPDRITATFFEGAGFAFAYVIPVIAGATMFAEGMRINGLIDDMARLLRTAPHYLTVAAVVVGWLAAIITGTAVGTAPLIINMLLPIAMAGGGASATTTGMRVGAHAAIAAQFGRTSSPVAPVVIMCATLSRDRPIALVLRVLPPLAAGAVVLLIVSRLWH